MNDELTVPSLPRAAKNAPAIDGYQIVEELGRGGMGVVYKARQQTGPIQRLVALKLIGSADPADLEEIQRFLREANVLASIQHPNIVTVYAAEWRDGCPPFIAMELLEGGSLAEKLAGKPQSAEEAARMVQTLARAMHSVHQHGILHCDLKPGNVLLDAHGTPKIGDFGLARRLEDNLQSRSLGAVRGTPSYMPPEQASGMCRTLRASADVYALGAILYEMLTGRPPFLGIDSWDTIRQVLSDEVAPPSRLIRVPYDLETICLKCLQKAPCDRYASADALADDLHRFLQNEPIHASRPGMLKRLRLWGRRKPAAAVAIGLTAAAVLIVVVLSVFYNVELFAANQRTQKELERATELSERRRTSLQLSAYLTMDHGLNLCRQLGGNQEPFDEQINYGLLWLGRALEIADRAEDDKLQSAIRRQLAFWHKPPKLSALSQHKGPDRTIAISPDGKSFLTDELPEGVQNLQNGRGVARLRQMKDGRQIGGDLEHKGALWAVAFSPDFRLLAATDNKGCVQLWQLEDGKNVGALIGPHGPFRCVAFHPKDGILVTGGQDKKVRFWEIAELLKQKPPAPNSEPVLEQEDPVVGLAFHPQGHTLLIISAPTWDPNVPLNPRRKGQARLWDVKKRQYLGALFQPYFPPLTATAPPGLGAPAIGAFSPCAPFVLTQGEGRPDQGQLWDLATRRPLGPPLWPVKDQRAAADPRSIRSASFSRDGKTIFLANEDATPWAVTDLPVVEGDIKRILLWIKVRTGMELDDNGVEHHLKKTTLEGLRQELEKMGGPPFSEPPGERR